MPKLYRKDTGEAVQVPDDQVLAALESGEFGFQAGQKIYMRSAHGETFSGSPEGVLEMYRRGYRLESGEEQRKRILQEKYGSTGHEIATALAGAARGVSFGLSDVALVDLFGVEKETLKGMREASSRADILGELGGIAGSLFVGGGPQAAAKASKLGALLRQTTAAPRAVAKLGTAVERGTIRALQGTRLGRAGAKAIGTAAGSAVEGALYGAGAFVSEAALGDVEPNAESLVAHMEAGTIFGGLAGGGFSLGGMAGRKILTGGKNYAKRTARGIVNMWERQTGNKAIPGLVERLEQDVIKPGMPEKLSGVIAGKDPGAIARFTRGEERKVNRALATTGKDVRDTHARDMARHHDTMIRTQEKVFDAGIGKRKKLFMKEMARDGDLALASAEADQLFGLVDDGAIIQQLRMMKERGRGYYDFQGGKFGIDDMLKKAEATRDQIRLAVRRGHEGDLRAIGEIHSLMDDFKRSIGKGRSKMNRVFQIDSTSVAAAEEYQKMYHLLRKPLENARTWGKTAATFQRETNAAWVEHLSDIKRKPNHRFTESYEGPDWSKEISADPAGYRKYVDDMGSTRNDKDEPWLLNQLETGNGVMERIAKQHDDAELWQALREHTEALKKFKEIHEHAKKTVGLQNQLDDLTKGGGQGMFGGMAIGGGLGAYALTGDETTAAGVGLATLALSAMSRPGRAVHSLATLDRLLGGFRESISRKVGNYVQNIKRVRKAVEKRAKRLIAPAAARIPASVGVLEGANWGDRVTSDRDRYQAFERRSNELGEFLSNPQVAADRLAWNTSQIQSVAPKLAAQMQMVGARAAAFLHEKAPKDPGTTMLRGKWRPSDSELSKFERYAAATLKPETVLDDLNAGRITREGVEVLREVYPHIYRQIQAELASRVEEIREEIPYQERIQLAILFDVPVDETMSPEFLAAMIPVQPSTQPATPQPGRGPGTRKGDFRKMKSVQFAQTQAQGLDLRRRTA